MTVIAPPSWRYWRWRLSHSSFHCLSISHIVVLETPEFERTIVLREKTSKAKQETLVKPFFINALVQLFAQSRVGEFKCENVPLLPVGFSKIRCSALSGAPDGLDISPIYICSRQYLHGFVPVIKRSGSLLEDRCWILSKMGLSLRRNGRQILRRFLRRSFLTSRLVKTLYMALTLSRKERTFWGRLRTAEVLFKPFQKKAAILDPAVW